MTPLPIEASDQSTETVEPVGSPTVPIATSGAVIGFVVKERISVEVVPEPVTVTWT